MSEARPSATVVLLRQADKRPQVFMVKRHPHTAFGMAYAFPGGVVDRSDRDAHAHCAGLQTAQADRQLAVGADGLDFYSAAIRELFEETGVLLARDQSGNWAFEHRSGEQSILRNRLNDKELGWPELLKAHQLRIACDALHYFAHWITPLSEARRFSTHFFAAEMPQSQQANHDGTELTDGLWISASDVLAAKDAGSMNLIFPTFVTLKAIRDCTSVAEVLAWANHQAAGGVTPVRSSIVDINGKKQVVLAGEDLYPHESDG